ncbi:Na/Pi cotransporter family protein [Methylobacterium sp. ID0610]|uniref:Na/Pi cotransporter family protein n=1 Tax=Methylobacterium carpenticola TaxID=3344827 RepID=UPI003688FA37
MTGTIVLLDLAGFVALLLWGIHMIRTGVQRAWGADLRRWLGENLHHPLKAFLAGLGVTLLLQSSTATGMMATAFVSGGLIALVPALAVMLGANVGTALIVKALSFDVAKAAPVLILVGAVAFGRAGGAKGRALGRIAIGLGLVLLALFHLVETLAPLGDAPGMQVLLGALSADPVIALLLAALFAWAAHSSVAVVLVVAALAQQGIVPLATALALVLGANLGSAVNPLVACRETAGRRVALGNLLLRLAGCALALPWLAPAASGLSLVAQTPREAVADLHVLFNLVLALAGLPLLHPLARLLHRLLPDREEPGAVPALTFEAGLAAAPAVALGLASRHALRMADDLETMLRDAARLLRGEETQERIRLGERSLEQTGGQVQRFLAGLDPGALAEAEERRHATLVSFTIQIGHAGDVLARTLAPQIVRRRKLAAEGEGTVDLHDLLGRLTANLRTAAALLVTEDGPAARLLASEKRRFRALEDERIAAHVASLRGGPADAASRGIDLDLLRDCKRINDHIVAAAAYPILRSSGDLLDSRLRTAKSEGSARRPSEFRPQTGTAGPSA